MDVFRSKGLLESLANSLTSWHYQKSTGKFCPWVV